MPFFMSVVLQMDEQTVNRTIANCLLQMLTCDNVRLINISNGSCNFQ